MKKQSRKKQFYSHIVSLKDVEIELDTLELSEHEKNQLSEMAHEHLHYTILDVVLSNLSDEDKKTFAHHANSVNHTHTLRFLKTKIANFEKQVKTAAENLQRELIADIKDIKNESKNV